MVSVLSLYECSRVVIFFVRHGGFTDGRTDDFPVTRSRGRASCAGARARTLAESRTAHAATRVHLRVCPPDLDFLQQRHEPRPFRLLGTFTGHFAARPPSRKSSAPGGAICPRPATGAEKFGERNAGGISAWKKWSAQGHQPYHHQPYYRT